jgi:hypothetical protein
LARPRSAPSHRLPRELILSLTSYPARFGTLHLTLACLLDQTVRPDRTILWLAQDDMRELPATVRELEMRGLEIRLCDDLRSFKKLIPALEEFPSAYLVTADDDLYYRRDWLETLVDGAKDDAIVCHRAHRIKRGLGGSLAPYLQWESDVQDQRARGLTTDILPTSGAGALYPPGSLAPIVTDRSKFQRLCPDSDDLWFYWCARMAGTKFRKVGPKMWLIAWPGTQESSLWDSNERGGNDAAICALGREFGYTE